MRTKRDPGIRQEAFIHVATKLFMEKGYEEVSVRDILDAVADKTASPSVFYYYFSSKDALYQACVDTVAQAYLSEMRFWFAMDGITLDEWMLTLVSGMEKYLLDEKALIKPGMSVKNRLFVLDIRDQVTRQISGLWANSLTCGFSLPREAAVSMAHYLAGGIGEMLFCFLTDDRHEMEDVFRLTESIVSFSANTINCSSEQKLELISKLKESHNNRKKVSE